MTIEQLKRVLWRLEEDKQPRYMWKQLRVAIMRECGTDERTITNTIKRLLELDMIVISVAVDKDKLNG